MASEDGNEDEDDVEDADNRHQDPDGNTPPRPMRTYPEQEKADHQFKKGSDGDVEKRGDPSPHGGRGPVCRGHILNKLADAIVDGEKSGSRISAIQDLEGLSFQEDISDQIPREPGFSPLSPIRTSVGIQE